MPDEKILGLLQEGDVVQINGNRLIVDDVRPDTEGSLQVTFLTTPAYQRKREAACREFYRSEQSRA